MPWWYNTWHCLVWNKCARLLTFTLLLSNDCTVKISLYRNDSISFLKKLPTHENCIRAVSSSKHNGKNSSLLIVSEGKLDMSFYWLNKMFDTTDLCNNLSFYFLYRNHLHYLPSIDHQINAVKGSPLQIPVQNLRILFCLEIQTEIFILLLSLNHLIYLSEYQVMCYTIISNQYYL